MAQPTFFGDGSTPRRSDTQWVILQKILGALNDGAGVGGTGNLTGVGSPEGVVTADEGRLYVDTATTPSSLWVKDTGSGNTGWYPLIQGS